MTEVFGPCGQGWSYTIDKLWTEPGPEGVVMAFALVSLNYLPDNAKESVAIPGIGGSAMVAKEKDGLRANDEAYKMAVTDALSVAMKALGVGADIYLGRWDGTKYTEAATEAHRPSDGAMEGLSVDMQTAVRETAKDAIGMWNSTKDASKAQNWLEAANFETEAKIAVWALLPSDLRSAIKRLKDTGVEGLKNMKDDIP